MSNPAMSTPPIPKPPESAPQTAAPPVLVLIAAVARNGVIGHDNALLWHLPEDLAHFRRHTAGHAVVMGRRTWDSLPPRFRPLPGRRNIVVTRNPQWQAEGAERAASPAAARALLAGVPRAFVSGGAALYAAALPWADELLLTEIDRDFEGDTHFPAWDRADFVEVAREHHAAAAPDGPGPGFGLSFDFVTYRRANPR